MAKRVAVLFSAIAIAFVSLFSRLFLLMNDPRLLETAATQGSYVIELGEERGAIYDRNMLLLVNDQTVKRAVVVPSAESMADITNLVSPEKRERLLSAFQTGTPFVTDIDDQSARDGQWRDIKIISQQKRYSDPPVAPHVIGYISGTGEGVSGIEKAYDEYLRTKGKSTSVRYYADALGNVLKGMEVWRTDTQTDHGGIVLTLDKRIQLICQSATKDMIKKGAVVVMSVENGDVLACASFPEFDPNNVGASLDDENGPLLNRALLAYNVGSTFKLCVAAAALEEGIDPNENGYCDGTFKIGDTVMGCHFKSGHGLLNMKGAIGISCNPYFIALGLRLGADPIINMAQSMGFGRACSFGGLALSGGLLPSSESLRSNVALANLSFGQGDLMATPLQIAAMISSIANGGYAVTPRIVIGKTDEKCLPHEKGGRIMSEKTAEALREYMIFTVEKKSGSAAMPERLSAGGKTASAETGIKKEDGSMAVQAWFSGFYPAINPKIAIVVLNEEMDSGAEWAAPVFKKIADAIYNQNLLKDL